jgi:hypothetical protein
VRTPWSISAAAKPWPPPPAPPPSSALGPPPRPPAPRPEQGARRARAPRPSHRRPGPARAPVAGLRLALQAGPRPGPGPRLRLRGQPAHLRQGRQRPPPLAEPARPGSTPAPGRPSPCPTTGRRTALRRQPRLRAVRQARRRGPARRPRLQGAGPRVPRDQRRLVPQDLRPARRRRRQAAVDRVRRRLPRRPGDRQRLHPRARGQRLFSPFRVDITDIANIGAENTLVVRVDASLGEGWFYEGAGLYRHVWLVKTAPVHVPQWGVFVRAKVDGTLTIDTDLVNEGDARAEFELLHTVLDAAGKPVLTPAAAPGPPAGLGAPVAVADRDPAQPRPVDAGDPAPLQPGHRGEGRRRGRRSLRHPLRRPLDRVRRRQGLPAERPVREAEGNLQPPGPRRRRRGHPRRPAGLAAGAAEEHGLQRLSRRPQSADAGAAGRLRPPGHGGDRRDPPDVQRPDLDGRAGAPGPPRPQPPSR